jgi:hypothetical protein
MAGARLSGKGSKAARSQKLDTLWQFSNLVANLQAMGGAAKEMALRILAATKDYRFELTTEKWVKERRVNRGS